MLVHCLTLKFAKSAGAADIEAFRAAIARLPSQMDFPVHTRQGADIGERETNADYAVISEFSNAEEFRQYLVHPAHLAVPRDHVESFHSVQFLLEDSD